MGQPATTNEGIIIDWTENWNKSLFIYKVGVEITKSAANDSEKKRKNIRPCKGTAFYHPSAKPLDENWDHFLDKDNIEHLDPTPQQFL